MSKELTIEEVVQKVQEGVRIKTLDEDRELIVNQVIGYHPSVGFNFSGRYATPAGVDARSGQVAYGGRGFLFSDFNKRWTFSEGAEEIQLKKFRVYGSYMTRNGLNCLDMFVDAIDSKTAEKVYYENAGNGFYKITRVEEIKEAVEV